MVIALPPIFFLAAWLADANPEGRAASLGEPGPSPEAEMEAVEMLEEAVSTGLVGDFSVGIEWIFGVPYVAFYLGDKRITLHERIAVTTLLEYIHYAGSMTPDLSSESKIAGRLIAAQKKGISRLLVWRTFWAIVIRNFALEGALAVAIAAADGPIPIGDLLALGMTAWMVLDLVQLWPELWSQAEEEAEPLESQSHP